MNFSFFSSFTHSFESMRSLIYETYLPTEKHMDPEG